MKTIFPESVQFNGVWRPYQARVLNRLASYQRLENKIHIVAPPGSGKTVLGLEVMLRQGKPAVIFAPSVAIREQWKSRFQELFIEDPEDMKTISSDIRHPGLINVMTYQALHTAFGKESGSHAEDADYGDLDLLQTFEKLQIETIVLDEAHHLRKEWYQSLEKVCNRLHNATTVSLTATPPYDVPLSEWQRYTQLCGEIDEEILVTELVADQNLCPHQDYVYFNFPTQEETAELKSKREALATYLSSLSARPDLLEALAQHPVIADHEKNTEQLLSTPAYFTSILVFLHHAGMKLPRELIKMIGNKSRLPELSPEWMEILLQGFLFDDAERYATYEKAQNEIKRRLSFFGCIQKRRVNLTDDAKLSRRMMLSAGKLKSINEIVKSEYRYLKSDLRMLILTDYIKKNVSLKEDLTELGVVPIFEHLRREQISGLKLGILSGSFVVIPEEAQKAATDMATQFDIEITFRKSDFEGYVEVWFRTSGRNKMVAVITELFMQGRIHVLVGTQALLGEGWDAPCINALILASFVGSFMLSNQMRGRAIRVDKNNPNKTANIWHLVCMEPLWAYEKSVINQGALYIHTHVQNKKEPVSKDFYTLTRRFKAFIGVGYTKNIIENGMDRLSFIKPPFTRDHVEDINHQMLSLSSRREQLRQRWNECLSESEEVINAYDMMELDKRLTARSYVFVNAYYLLTLGILFLIINPRVQTVLFDIPFLFDLQSPSVFVSILTFLIALVLICLALLKIFDHLSPRKSLKRMGKALLKSLQKSDQIKTAHVKVVTMKSGSALCSVGLEGGTTLEKRQFSDGMKDMLGVIDNPRYLLASKKKRFGIWMEEYYSVPECLGKNKESAEIMHSFFNQYIGKFDLIYTRNEEGRKVLLQARTKSFVHKNSLKLEGKTVLHGEWK